MNLLVFIQQINKNSITANSKNLERIIRKA